MGGISLTPARPCRQRGAGQTMGFDIKTRLSRVWLGDMGTWRPGAGTCKLKEKAWQIRRHKRGLFLKYPKWNIHMSIYNYIYICILSPYIPFKITILFLAYCRMATDPTTRRHGDRSSIRRCSSQLKPPCEAEETPATWDSLHWFLKENAGSSSHQRFQYWFGVPKLDGFFHGKSY